MVVSNAVRGKDSPTVSRKYADRGSGAPDPGVHMTSGRSNGNAREQGYALSVRWCRPHWLLVR